MSDNKTLLQKAIDYKKSKAKHLSKILKKHQSGELKLSLNGKIIEHEISVLNDCIKYETSLLNS